MRRTTFAEGEYYHLYNRGVDKRTVFSTRGDFERFKAYLYLLNDEESTRASNFFEGTRGKDPYENARGNPLVAIGAYCLMPNHFHLLVTPLLEHGVPRFMQKLLTAYTMYFNERTLRSGSLFEGTYKSRHAESDTYLKYLYAYIHLNPARFFITDWQKATEGDLHSLEHKIATYPYSSAHEYFTSKYVITSPSHFPRHFVRAKDIRSHLNFWLRFRVGEEKPVLGET
ncbi:MAG: transposase [Patescibacteria group bacterium]